MDGSIFTNKTPPDERELSSALSGSYRYWEQLKQYVLKNCTGTKEEWNFSKLGWNYRIKDKKRVIIYMMPCDRFFRVSLVLGPKAVEKAIGGDLSGEIKAAIKAAKTYAEGTGFRVDIKDGKLIPDIITLIGFKTAS